MDTEARYRWIATHIFTCEGEVRRWLRRNIPTLPLDEHDDLLQEAYARLWEIDFTGITNGRSYFYSIVRNLVVEQSRRARIVPMERMSEIETLRMVSEEPGPERRVTSRQELERLLRIIATLPAKCRQVFELRSFEGCSRPEIAQRMGISHRTVENHLRKALDRVGDTLAQDDAASEKHHRPAARNSENDANQ